MTSLVFLSDLRVNATSKPPLAEGLDSEAGRSFLCGCIRHDDALRWESTQFALQPLFSTLHDQVEVNTSREEELED
jgi:hypothetical protein